MGTDDYFGSRSFHQDLVDVMSEDILRVGATARRPSQDELELAQFHDEVSRSRDRRSAGQRPDEDECDDYGE